MNSSPDPQTLLQAILDTGRGRHKIYVGASAGVGKTYRALQELRERLEAGVDAVVGYLETHGRAETAKLAEGLPLWPRKQVEYMGLSLSEMDLEGLLKRQPKLVLVDELAHTNVAGSKNPKRWQDVEELLEAGIDVISTINIQHLESLNDLVARLTAVRVKERVPDRLLLEADEVVLVDVTPQVLQERLKSGKIYPTAKIEQALANFFSAENLAVLRELALRQVADKVEEDASVGEGSLGLRERICVAVTPSAKDALLIRRGAKMARGLRGKLYVVHVQRRRLSREEERVLDRHRVLSESLEGAFYRLQGRDVARSLAGFVKEQRITQMVVGENSNPTWRDFFRLSIIQRLIYLTHDIDIHVMDHRQEDWSNEHSQSWWLE